MFKMEQAAISGAAVLATATAGSYYTQQATQSPWYAQVRPGFAPPNWVFPLVWTTLYIGLAVAFAASLAEDTWIPTILHVANLALNVLWCRTFFGQRDIRRGLGVIVGNVAVAVGILATTRIPTVRWIVLPYIAWLLFATALNAGALTRVQ
jgi:benzodiazapine receptor